MKKNGGPAFPYLTKLTQDSLGCADSDYTPQTTKGMSLRDYFAAAALKGWIVRAVESETMPEDLAVWAYKHADAMIAERDKP